MTRVSLIAVAALVLAGCGGMSSEEQTSARFKLVEISGILTLQRLSGDEFEMEKTTRQYVTMLRGFVDKGFPKTEARRLLADLASDEAEGCSVCVEILDRERESL